MTEYYKRGQYIPGLQIDGMDVLAVLAAVKHGKKFALDNGPLVYEFVTYRYAGHSMSDPGTAYRTRDELQSQRSNDPITNFRDRLIEWGVFTHDDAKAIDKEVRETINKAKDVAESMPVPEQRMDILYEDIYVRGSEPRQRRGRTIDETYYQG